MTELKRCPFCGGKAHIEQKWVTYGNAVRVYCKSCNAKSNYIHISAEYCARDKVKELWNGRVKQ